MIKTLPLAMAVAFVAAALPFIDVVDGSTGKSDASSLLLGSTPPTLGATYATAGYVGSPFGFHPASVAVSGYPDNGFVDAQNIGVGWHRPPVYAFWFMIQPVLNTPFYDWTMPDGQYGQVPVGISILANIAPQGPGDEGRLLPGSWIPVDIPQYAAFVQATVERYDGDGLSDMPGLTNPVKYWQVGNEPGEQMTSDFAVLQQISYQAIKLACPDCTVLIGGVPGFPDGYINGFDADYAPILADLAGQYVDVFDFHWYGTATGDYRFRDSLTAEDVYTHVRNALTTSGFSPSLPIWITEMGSYSGHPPAGPLFTDFPPQTERQQASDYFKRFIYSFSRGVQVVFPAFGLIEGFVAGQRNYFDHTGLVYNGIGTQDPDYPDADPDDLGLGVKKLGYYTYKKMTEALNGADWSSLTTLRDGTGSDQLYLFSVEKDGRPIRIAWWDYFDDPAYTPGDTKPMVLTGFSGTTVTATAVVPSADIGQEVTDYATAFTVTTYSVSGGSATILLDEDPVLVEETADLPITGRRLLVKDSETDPAKRRLFVKFYDASIAAPSPGSASDPTIGGVLIEVVNPTTGEADAFSLPATNWAGRGTPSGSKGYRYRDGALAVGPCNMASVKDGKFKASCKGSQISFTLDETSQGSLGVNLTHGTDTRYCAVFGGTILKDTSATGAKRGVFKAKSAPAPGACAAVP